MNIEMMKQAASIVIDNQVDPYDSYNGYTRSLRGVFEKFTQDLIVEVERLNKFAEEKKVEESEFQLIKMALANPDAYESMEAWARDLTRFVNPITDPIKFVKFFRQLSGCSLKEAIDLRVKIQLED